MTRRLRTAGEVREILEREGHDYADILDAMDEVEPAAEVGDDYLYDAAGIAAIRTALED